MTAPRIDPPPSPKLRPWHLDRSAIVYVRQSTPQQVTDHQESTARQYALVDRAIALGWPRSQVQVIDDDLGKSGQSIEGRPGFQRLLAEVALDRVGLIAGASVYPFVWNILLAARNEGFGGVLTTGAVAEEPRVKELLGIPDDYAVAALLPIGKPVKQVRKLTRRPVAEFASKERFDGAPL